MATELWQFRYSPYNEKARWGLAIKGIAHDVKTVLPGPHAGAMRRLSGQTKTPVLVIDGQVTANSADILARLESLVPEPALLPSDGALSEEALGLQSWFDDHIGPRLRKVVLHSMLGDFGYIATTFAGDQPWLKRSLYRMVLPLAASRIRRGNGIGGPDDIADGHVAILEGLDLIGQRVKETGYLVGGGFTLADLTAASIMAPVVNPDHPAMRRPEPMPSPTRDLIARYALHPGADWVRRIYRDHRP